MKLFDMFCNGASLNRPAIAELELSLIQDPHNRALHFQLMGYYRYHQYCCKGARDKFQREVIWAINHIQFSDLQLGLCYHLDDCNSGFAEVLTAWNAQLQARTADHLLIGNFAQFLESHRPEEAENLYKRALAVRPTHKGLQKMLDSFQSRKPKLIERLANAPPLPHLPIQKLDGTFCNGEPGSLP